MATITWNNGNGGDWNTALDWTPNQVPGASDDADITASGTYTVTITSGGVAVNSLTTAAGATLAIGSGDTLTVLGTQIINAGVIQIAAGSNNSELATGQAVSLTGGGTLTLSNSGSNVAFLVQAASGSPLTNVDNTIQGSGQIGGNTGLVLVNQGTVDANVSGQALALNGGGVTNSNLLEATNGGTLAISTSVTNTNGNITANGGTVTIGNSATITGGTLNSSGAGLLQSIGGGITLNGVTISSGSTYTIGSGSTNELVGTIVNDGTIQIAAGPNNAELATDGPVSLTGGGTVTLSNTGSSVPGALIAQAVGSSPLTNVDNTIQGFGQIGGSSGLALVNQGTVDANVSGQTLALDGSGGVTNSNLLEATNGGTLAISTSVTNTNGNITANGGTVTIGNSATITGGTLNSSGAGLLQSIGGGITLNGVTISSGSTYTIGSGSTNELVGTIVNDGTIQIAAGPNNAELATDGPVSLTGGGTVTLSNTGSSVPGALIAQAVGSSPLTNVDNTIQGFGQIGGSSGLALVNQGTVDANVSGQTLALDGSGGVTNSHLLEATNGGLLNVTSAIGGSGQLVIGAGSEIELGGATSEMATFTGATNAKLRLDVPQSYTGTIASFAPGDIFELANTNALTATPTLNGANTTLTVNLSGGGTLTYTFAGNLTNDIFPITHVGSDSDITVQPQLAGQISLTTATEQVALAAGTTVATFTDSNATDTAGGFTASINWGDGTITTGTVSGSNGSFAVAAGTGGHTYADEGSDPVSVTITRTSDGATTTPTGNVVVGENDHLSGTGTTINALTNQALSNVVVASFTDTDLVTPASDLVATINWGDGTATTGGTVSGTGGTFQVTGSHTYTSPATDTVMVTLSDDAPGTATATATTTANVTGGALAGQVVLTTATEQVALAAGTTVATFTDSNATDTAGGFTASINWGDGTITTGTVSGSNGSFAVAAGTGGHTYADEGSDPVSVTITRTSDGATTTPTGNVVVGENDHLSGTGTTINALTNQALSNVVVASFTDTDLVTPASDLVATINWGDGTATTGGTVSGTGGTFQVTGSHTYTSPATDTVMVTLSDDAPGTATATASSTASVGAQLAVQVTLSGTPQEGQRLTASASSNDAQATIHYQWQSSIDGVTFNPIANAADASTYVLQESDEDLEIRVTATAVDTQAGATASAISSPTIAVTDIVPSLSVTIGGASQQGQTLAAIAVADDSDATITYHWQVLNGANWSNIKGATGSTYTVTELNEGHQLRAVATSTDSDGSGTTATSTPTNPVIDVTPTISVTERGVPQEGRILTATVHVTSDGDRGTTTYQWEELIGATWTAIADATRRTYTMTEANEGNELRVLATFTDDTGQTVSATSSPTSPILDRPAALSIAHHSLSVPAGGTVALPIRVAESDSDDTVSVTISGLTSFETVTDKFDDSVFSGSSITLSAAEVNSGLTLQSSYSGSGHPVNTLTVTATNTTVGESATIPAQIITVTDPPASGSGPGQTVVSKSTTGMKLDQAENFSGVVSNFSTSDRTLANSDRIDLVDINHHSPSSGHQFNSTTDTLTVTDGAKTAPPSINPSIGHIVMHDPGQGVTPVTMEDPGPAPNRIVAVAPNQTLSGFVSASDNFVFNFARSDHIMKDFHPHSDVLEFDELIFANAQAILNVLHDDCHGNPVIAVDGHETTSLGGALKAHLHAADFHLI